MSDMLEMLMKRMDILARLENSTDFHKGDEARFPLDRSVTPCGAWGLCRSRTPPCAELLCEGGRAQRDVGLGEIFFSLICHVWNLLFQGF